MMPLVTLHITPDIALKIKALAEAGVFTIKTGNATINFHEGVLKSIKTDFFYYPEDIHKLPLDTSVLESTLQ